MVELDEETIDVLKRVKDALKGSKFEVNRIELQETGAGGVMLCWDVRKHEED